MTNRERRYEEFAATGIFENTNGTTTDYLKIVQAGKMWEFLYKCTMLARLRHKRMGIEYPGFEALTPVVEEVTTNIKKRLNNLEG